MNGILYDMEQKTFNMFCRGHLTKVVPQIDNRVLIFILNTILKQDAGAKAAFGIYVYIY